MRFETTTRAPYRIELRRDGELISRHVLEREALSTALEHAALYGAGDYVLSYPSVTVRVIGTLGAQSADTQAPTVPLSLVATPVNRGRIDLTWQASTDNVGVTGYQVFRGGLPLGTAATASYSDTSCLPSTSYTYTVAAYDGAGNTSSPSGPASATTPANAAPVWQAIPNQSPIVSTAFSLNLATYCSDADQDAITYSVVPGVALPSGLSLVSGVVSGTPTTAGETRAVVFRASDGFTTADRTVSFQTYLSDATAPPVPTGLAATPVSSSQVNLSWNASTDAAGQANEYVSGTSAYRVYRDGALRTTTAATSYSDTGLAANTQYSYRVSARDVALNESAQATAVTPTTLAGALTAEQDWQARSTMPGVLWATRFDTENEVRGYVNGAEGGNFSGYDTGKVLWQSGTGADAPASGSRFLRFNVAAGQGPGDSVQNWVRALKNEWSNSATYPGQQPAGGSSTNFLKAGEEVYVQFRFRVPPARFFNALQANGGGWKILNLSKFITSLSAQEHVVNNFYYEGSLQSYYSDSFIGFNTSKSYAASDPIDRCNLSDPDYLLNNALDRGSNFYTTVNGGVNPVTGASWTACDRGWLRYGATYSYRNGGWPQNSQVAGHTASASHVWGPYYSEWPTHKFAGVLYPDEWHTIQIRFKTNSSSYNNLEWEIQHAPPGQNYTTVISSIGHALPTAPTPGIQALWFTAFDTGLPANLPLIGTNQDVDEVICARRSIPPPGYATAAPAWVAGNLTTAAQWMAVSGASPGGGLSATDTAAAWDPGLTNEYQGNSQFPGIVSAYNGGAWASRYSTHGAILLYGGGHNDYHGNEIVAWNANTRAWARIKDPYAVGTYSPPYTNGLFPDGTPNPSHTYAQVGVDPGTNSLVVSRTQQDDNPSTIQMVMMCDLSTLTWRPSTINSSNHSVSDGWTVYDSQRGCFWFEGGRGQTSSFTRFNPAINNGDGTYGTYQNYTRKVILGPAAADYSPTLDKIMVIGQPSDVLANVIKLMDPANPNGSAVQIAPAGSGPTFSLATSGPHGLRWSVKRGAFLYWQPGSANVYELKLTAGAWNTGTWTWANLTTGGSPPSLTGSSNGLYNRFFIARWGVEEVVLIIGGVNDAVYAWKVP